VVVVKLIPQTAFFGRRVRQPLFSYGFHTSVYGSGLRRKQA
jgi:hypothetical protein